MILELTKLHEIPFFKKGPIYYAPVDYNKVLRISGLWYAIGIVTKCPIKYLI